MITLEGLVMEGGYELSWEDGARAIVKTDKKNSMKIDIVSFCSSHTGMPSPYSSDLSA